MKIAFAVNDIRTEQADYATTHMVRSALSRGHDVYYIAVADFACGPDESVDAWAVHLPRRRYRSVERLLQDVQSPQAPSERISLDDFDVLFLRNDPAEDVVTRPWARLAGINFGRLAQRRGVLVLNDPVGLTHAVNKTYMQLFPEAIRPRTLITRHREDIKAFARDHGGPIVLKPLAGSGGRNVFLVRPKDVANINQIIDAVVRDGYAIAQEYLPKAAAGDVRIFMLEGRILERDGVAAAIHRVRTGGDLRSNLTVGGQAKPARITRAMQRLAEQVRPRLVEDGMFFVGLDVVGDKVIEINVFSPGGLCSASSIAGADFSADVIAALERRVAERSGRADR